MPSPSGSPCGTVGAGGVDGREAGLDLPEIEEAVAVGVGDIGIAAVEEFGGVGGAVAVGVLGVRGQVQLGRGSCGGCCVDGGARPAAAELDDQLWWIGRIARSHGC